jgi:hypothetical protein
MARPDLSVTFVTGDFKRSELASQGAKGRFVVVTSTGKINAIDKSNALCDHVIGLSDYLGM